MSARFLPVNKRREAHRAVLAGFAHKMKTDDYRDEVSTGNAVTGSERSELSYAHLAAPTKMNQPVTAFPVLTPLLFDFNSIYGQRQL
jgi:hypothetical protein